MHHSFTQPKQNSSTELYLRIYTVTLAVVFPMNLLRNYSLRYLRSYLLKKSYVNIVT